MIKKRDIALNLILTIITCGIYGLVWFITITDDTNIASSENEPSGIISFILSILTCGIYGMYWYYRIGKQLYRAKINKGLGTTDNSLIYLILGIFSFGVISNCLIQSELNDIALNV
ncbi:MAG: DUF4234 domain-containing protein [Bacilli bacterium]